MEDHHDHESHADVPHGTNKGSPENPCLKSSGSSSNNNNNNNTNNSNSNTNTTINKEQDRFLPIANVGRIMKKVIPSNGKISKDAKETVQECVSEFISFVTGEASDKCQREKRKTINGDDIIWAITTLGFEEYVGPLKLYLSKYREIEGEKLNIPKQQRLSEQQKQQQQQQHQQHQPDHHHDQKQNMLPYNSSVYSSTSMLSFVPSSDHQPFSLPFSSNSIQKQLQQQQDHQIDSVGHW